jgi:hypothetical protein
MPAGTPLLLIYRALRTLLIASTPLTSRLASAAAVYADGAVPQGSTMPYLTMGAATQIGDPRFGAATTTTLAPTVGWNCTLQIKAVGQGKGEDVGLAIMHEVGTVLQEGTDLTLAGYGSAFVDEFELHPTLITTAPDGIVTREWPAILRVRAYD